MGLNFAKVHVQNFRGDKKIRGFRGHLTREIKSPRNLIPVKINPFKVDVPGVIKFSSGKV